MADQFLALLEREKPNILKMLPGDRDAAQDERARERWWALTYELSRNSRLRKCADQNPMSLLNAIKKFADWGLVPDGDEGFINVYNTQQDDNTWLPEASPEPMYKGVIRRAVEAGVITHCVADVLREGDTCNISIGTKGRVLEVVPAPPKRGRKLTGGYALFWLTNGLMDYELFDEEDIERVKGAALRNAQRQKKDAKLSPAWQFSEPEMVKKSVIKRGMKRMRGRRDTDAGRRFAEVVAVDNKFDVEVDSVELPPDDLPQGRETASRLAGATPAPATKPSGDVLLKLQPDKPVRAPAQATRPPDAASASPAPISDADIDDLQRQWRSLHNGKLLGLSDWLLQHFEVEDLAELRADQVAEVAQKMAEAT